MTVTIAAARAGREVLSPRRRADILMCAREPVPNWLTVRS